MRARDEWIEAGLDALRSGGADAVRIDSIALRLRKTKGSFHHHFAGIAAYQEALLEAFEQNALRQVDTLIDATAEESAESALAHVALNVQFDPALESAIRSWAGAAVGARETMARVDLARLEALTAIWSREIANDAHARVAALVPHLIIAGASSVQPTPRPEDLADVFALLVGLVPHVAASAPSLTDQPDP